MERRLSAILAADMVGYSRLMEADEAGTIERQKVLRRELINPSFKQHHGRIVKEMGDGILVEFPSVVDAVNCALAIQHAMPAREAEIPQDRRIIYRIGINLGDIVVEDDDLIGDGVNVATRLEKLSEPGGICISGTAYDQIEGRTGFFCSFLGAQKLKNISRPVRAYRISVSSDNDEANKSATAPAQPGRALPDKPSIAVLPFDNMSGDPDQEYFSDGITEDIINALGMWRSFPVIACNSSFAYKGKASDVRLIGKELGARYVLEGSVRKAEGRVRVNAQLVDADSGHQLWADRFDRSFVEIFDLQDEIVERIVAETAPEVLRAEGQRASQKRPTDLTAWDLILRAMSAKATGHGYGTKDGNDVAKEYLDRALRLEKSSEAWAWRALCDWHDAINGWISDSDKALDRCIEAARLSVNADDANWLAHSVLGIALLFGRQQAELAVGEAEQAVRLNPSSSMGRHILGCALDFAGRQEEALPHLESVFELDPRYKNRAAAYADLALANMLLGETGTAVGWAEKTVSADPDYLRGRQRLIAAFSAAGELGRARLELAEVMRRQPDFSLDYVRRTYPFANARQAKQFANWLGEAGVS